MLFKKINFLLFASLLAACSSEPSSAEEYTKHPPNLPKPKLEVSLNPLDQTRFSNSKTAGLICPQEPKGQTDYFCQHYAKESLKNKYPNIIQYLNNDRQLKIYLYDGSIKYYQPDPQLDVEIQNYISFHALAEYPQIDSLLILNTLYEDYKYILLNLSTGHETILSGLPIFSPDFKLMLSINSDIDIGFTLNEMNIYQLKQNQAHLIFDAVKHAGAFAEEYNIGFSAAKWLNTEKFILQSDYYNSLGQQDHEYFLVQKQNNIWQFKPLKFADYQKLSLDH